VHFQYARTLRGWAVAMLHSRTNDLKYYLAFARAGSMAAAAKALGVNQSTVQRRLTEFEDRLGRQLVTRHLPSRRPSRC
jgi:DNA-binding transcriptional LysR family regulator